LTHLREFAIHGTTTLEAKSGYGLDWKSEMKILNVLNELHQEAASGYRHHVHGAPT